MMCVREEVCVYIFIWSLVVFLRSCLSVLFCFVEAGSLTGIWDSHSRLSDLWVLEIPMSFSAMIGQYMCVTKSTFLCSC